MRATVRDANTTPPPVEKLAELWQLPEDLTTRDLFHGPGGLDVEPAAGAAYTWMATDTTGYSPGYDVRGPDGRTWDVKIGAEAQSEVVGVACVVGDWVITSRRRTTFADWQLSGGPGGQQQGARFRLETEDAEVIGEWSWSDNEFVGTQPYHGLIVANILMNSWDWKTNNNRIYHVKDGDTALAALRGPRSRRVVRRDPILPSAVGPAGSNARLRPGHAQ